MTDWQGPFTGMQGLTFAAGTGTVSLAVTAVSAALRVPSGVGSPANALAVV